VTQRTSFECFQNWKRWLEQCIAAQGNYFEKDARNLGVHLEIKLLLTNSRNLLNKTHSYLFIYSRNKYQALCT
jgi:hypothetical protein